MFGQGTSVLRLIRSRTCLLRGDEGWRCIRRHSGRLGGVSKVRNVIFGQEKARGGLTVGVEDGCLEAHLWRKQRVFDRESKTCTEEASYMTREYAPCLKASLSHTSIEFCVVVNHQHDLPLEHVVFHQTAAYSGYALVVLHLLELASQQPCRRR